MYDKIHYKLKKKKKKLFWGPGGCSLNDRLLIPFM